MKNSRKMRGLREEWKNIPLAKRIGLTLATLWIGVITFGVIPSAVRQPVPLDAVDGEMRIRRAQADAEAAKKAITDKRYELISGYCSRYVREVVTRRPGGAKYGYLFGASAKITANNFLRSPYGYHWPADKSKLGFIKPGDILFKRFGSGGYGHVGIYAGDVPGVGKMLVAENSSTSIGRIQGAKGYRTLGQFNKDKGVDVVGRLPEPARPVVPTPAPKPKRVLN